MQREPSDSSVHNAAQGGSAAPKPSAQFLVTALQKTPELARVEEIIRARLISEAPLLTEISRYLFDLGGKRMRPLFAILLSKALSDSGAVPDAIATIGAGIELIHMATLLHDDIIDRSPLRRHRESPLVKFGLGDSLLAGDFLLTRAFSLCATLSPAIIEATESACIALTEGEILETPLSREPHSIDSMLTIAKKKTAALFILAAFSAAHTHQVPQDAKDNLVAFGEAIGIAFQLLDDILDITSTASILGKPPGTDIRERKPSVVNLLWLEQYPDSAAFLRREPERGSIDEDTLVDQGVQFLLDDYERLNTGSVIGRAKALANAYTTKATDHLERAFADCPGSQEARDLLTGFIRFTIERLS